MKKLICFISLLLISFVNNAQIIFQKTYEVAGSDWGSSVQPTTDGGYIIIGNAGGSYVFLIKTDGNGDLLWIKTFGGLGYDFGFSGQQTTDGGYIIAGRTYSFGAGNYDVFLIRTDANGDTLWTKSYGGTGNDEGYSVQQTTDGGYIIAGRTNSFGNYDVYLIKADANGNMLWTKTYGGALGDIGNSVQQTADGGYIIAGGTSSFGAGYEDVYLIKTDSIGGILWTKTLGGTADEYGSSVQQTADGGYIITGETANGFGVYLIKTDTNGNAVWSKTFSTGDDDYGYSARQTTDGGYIVVGKIFSFTLPNSDVYLIKTNSTGDTLWTKTFGGTGYDACGAVQQTTDGGYILVGSAGSFVGINGVYLIKTDSLGNSGCNEGSTATIVTTPLIQVSSAATVITSPSTIVSTAAFTIGNGGTAHTLCTTVNISEIIPENSFFISPNPSAGNFIISFERTITKGKVEISNILGKNVFTENISNESKKEITIKNLTQGIYFVKVFNGEKSYCKKLIVEHN